MADRPSDLHFSLARRAVERGWVTREQVEGAVLACEKDPTVRLLDRLPLTPEQIRELERPARAAPAEVEEAMRFPERRVGRYWLVRHLKSGGMGSVHRAWDRDLGRWVALKFLMKEEDERARAYFRREAHVAASLDHPNIAKIYEVGEHQGHPFIAMQLIDGETLATATMKLDGKLDAARRIAEALRYAHSKG
ncbi:MAG: protein kinase, partial [Planctomycetes bacterium]|nr:protein kinase [Planctomycetota bacterium]